MAAASNHILSGLRILISRPQPQANQLANQLQTLGAVTECLPAIEIQPLSPSPEIRNIIMNIDQFDVVICVSQHAAQLTGEYLDEYWPQPAVGVRWYALGKGTSRALEAWGVTAAIPENGIDSESLLAQPGLQQVAEQKIAILKGQGGRPLLEETLSRRGAHVIPVALYERHIPAYSHAQLTHSLTDFDPQVLVALSAETLDNLLAMSEKHAINITQKAVVVPGERVAQHAKERGFASVIEPDGLSADSIASAISEWRQTAQATTP